MFTPKPTFKAHLDPDFMPAKLWNAAYQKAVEQSNDARAVCIHVGRPDGSGWNFATRMLPQATKFKTVNQRYGERLVKSLLWAWGGNRIQIEGAPDLACHLKIHYKPNGLRSFDAEFMGQTCFLDNFLIESVSKVPEISAGQTKTMNRDLTGCRIGFDLGGSDRKCAALIDGEVVFSEEIEWDPYFQNDPDYHLEGIRDSLHRAASALPRVDCIGGSAAGIYINNEPRVSSLFRGISPAVFKDKIRTLFSRLKKEWGGLPFEVANDGDVTALAGAMSLNTNAVLGISMGTSEAAGFLDATSHIKGWLNELAFVPVDYRSDAPTDEWSSDLGCGVQYFSQQAVGRLIPASGLCINKEIPLPERLEAVQEKMKQGDERAAAIYQTIGTYLGYSIPHYADFYDFHQLLFLGRVSSGEGGQIIQQTAETLLAEAYPELMETITISMPDEKMKRHGQAVAAASLPVL